ncbi:MAG: FAD-dependent oxidoreductase, partial [Acidimicrobiia bacterium]|nr:FAD-dependent oxidoreductase [Acidimicrobiia bacterium]
NILGAHHDVWTVNVEDEYHEESITRDDRQGGTGRDAPVLARESIDAAAARRREGGEG